jgi:hypothetical protein
VAAVLFVESEGRRRWRTGPGGRARVGWPGGLR